MNLSDVPMPQIAAVYGATSGALRGAVRVLSSNRDEARTYYLVLIQLRIRCDTHPTPKLLNVATNASLFCYDAKNEIIRIAGAMDLLRKEGRTAKR